MAIDYQKKLAEIMVLAAQQGASDLHISVGKHPTVRIDGNLVPISHEPILTPEMTAGLISVLLTPEQQDRLITEREIDFAFSFEDKVRFRVNIYFQKGYLSAALRLIPAKIRTIEELNLPPFLHEFTKYQQGFFLAVGPAGHGKTTTLAALIDEINHKRMDHIITIEDPIEYAFIQDRALIDQREVGSDTISFHRGLRSILRQDPDVIMVGEMRDPESISIALTAAETGHLIFSTLHTNSASQTIDRIVDSFPASQQSQIRSQLAITLIGIVSERLVPRISGGRIPVCEIMIANSAVKNLIREEKSYQIDLVIETSFQEGMTSLNRSLIELVRKREISLETAENYSLNPSELRQLLG
ncbi:MAG: PilT/PilU family type 4a pilus ATPase [Candidatus Paceibacterota bacterium]|jgi:twitching motility protein PilT|nr:PilT/PilU family type 4a pilus ATPase [Candidatus Paceibacterota bacterium]MDD3548695.1 PilT/PilU family type 4a pilus ATPase [Candidatus Paceibacterota bacterium]MDD4998981.1 PilT/PilU family type 4a pilus ATPase [Candidatus Paceibacterota bacterium]